MTLRKHYLIPLLAGGLAGAVVVACGSDSGTEEGGGNVEANGNGSNGSGGATGSGSTGGSTAGGSATGGENSNTTGGVNSGGGGTSDGLTLKFSPMFSAYDGVHIFKVPVQVEGADPASVEWSASKEGMVDIEPTPDGVMLTTLAGGEVTIMAKAGDLGASSLLTITEVAPEIYDLGKERYNNGIPAFDVPNFDGGLPTFGGDGGFSFPGFGDGGFAFPEGGFGSFFGDGGFRRPDGGFGGFGGDGGLPSFIDNESACTSCHGVGSDSIDVEHTPQQTGGYSDDDLVGIFTMGKKPEGAGFHALPDLDAYTAEQRQAAQDTLAGFGIDLAQIANSLGITRVTDQSSLDRLEARWSRDHQWQMTEDEKMGIVIYLRSLEPKSQGPLDFGGFPDVSEAIEGAVEGLGGLLGGGGAAGGQ